jgi:2,3-dihydroxybenzoate decarboxylase
MNGKIAFEEHMSLSETLEDSRSFAGSSGKWDEFARQILDIDAERLEGMERNGIDYTILSLNAPAVQAIL